MVQGFQKGLGSNMVHDRKMVINMSEIEIPSTQEAQYFLWGGGGWVMGFFGILCSNFVPHASIKVTKVFIMFSLYSSSFP
jgi:hypothetical protein